MTQTHWNSFWYLKCICKVKRDELMQEWRKLHKEHHKFLLAYYWLAGSLSLEGRKEHTYGETGIVNKILEDLKEGSA